ncbi:hypothetical protein D7B24_000614 [Verticillium nonalfalfae]|uniref:Thymocyte nuclear protein 1 n=1 Tax=Verticillium nonalfalfae TaxID=1051616 RepID=A0A3M9Y2N6_9PEZI|nr:uncharacterized protein D7B24_000614 [Verticillium nonalfalfae]RNJ54322.1 hypothetical protein D7B24_000614 [Verticillium nonalfalfae]
MVRLTRSQAAARQDTPKSVPAAPPPKTRKRQSDASDEDSPPAKRHAATSKPSTKATKSKPAPRGKAKPEPKAEPKSTSPEPKAAPPAKPAKKSGAASKKTAPPRKSIDELKALRDAYEDVPDVNPERPARDPPDAPMFWLMKSEPDVRIEDGYEIKFSIDDLGERKMPEGWDGIRNYVARNNLRQMKKGDKAFFYHSNCKEPGVVGLMTIVKEHSPDWNACINDNPYYDASAPHDGSKWSLVHVKIEHKFPAIVPLRLIKELPGDSPLKNMQLLKQSRLSVNKVTQTEFNEVIRIAKSLTTDKDWERTVAETKKLVNYSA